MRRSLLLALGVFAISCGGSSPSAPTPAVATCQTNNTGILILGNQSVNFTYDVSIDGIRSGALGPKQDSQPFTLAAGVAHSVIARYANTNVIACNASPILVQCQTRAIACSN